MVSVISNLHWPIFDFAKQSEATIDFEINHDTLIHNTSDAFPEGRLRGRPI